MIKLKPEFYFHYELLNVHCEYYSNPIFNYENKYSF